MKPNQKDILSDEKKEELLSILRKYTWTIWHLEQNLTAYAEMTKEDIEKCKHISSYKIFFNGENNVEEERSPTSRCGLWEDHIWLRLGYDKDQWNRNAHSMDSLFCCDSGKYLINWCETHHIKIEWDSKKEELGIDEAVDLRKTLKDIEDVISWAESHRAPKKDKPLL